MLDGDVRRFLAPELLEQLGDAVTLIDADWRYVYASTKAADIIGRPLDKILGELVWDIFPEVVGTPQHDACVRAMDNRTREHLVWFFETVNRWYEQYAIPAADGLLILVNDVTDKEMATRRSEQLVAVGEALARAATPAEINTALQQEALPMIGALGGAVLLADEEPRLMHSLGWPGLGAKTDDEWRSYPLDWRTPGNEAYRTGQPVYLADVHTAVERFPEAAEPIERLKPQSVAALPLASAGARLGALVVAFPPNQLPNDGDQLFLTTTAAMTAQALLRAKLLDTERRSIAALQRSLLPVALPPVDGMEMAVRYSAGDATSAVGGDWYDVIPLDGGGVGLVMGDVEGHDLAAAALMGLCRSAVRAYALEGHPPAIVVSRANEFLAGLMLGRLVTLSYAQLHPIEGLITVVSAGHPGTQVALPDGTVFEVPSESGPPLGVYDSGLRWQETSSTLPPHALFAQFTDGLVEVRGEDLDMGLGRIRAALVRHHQESVEDVADALLALRGASNHDDVALLTARLTAPVDSERQLTRRLPPTPASAFLARRSSRQLLGAWEVAGDIIERVELAVSELVSNAARHSEEAIEVRLSRLDSVLRLEVEDTSHRMLPDVPTLESLDEDATGGRGLLLVDTVASRWGADSDGLGKCIWAEFDL